MSPALLEAKAVAAKLADMMLYDVPNLSLGSVRVDVYSTFTADGGDALQKPILTTTAHRAVADALDWDALSPGQLLAHLETTFEESPEGVARPIALPPLEGIRPEARSSTPALLTGSEGAVHAIDEQDGS